jgi:hypothetical protein
MFAKLSLLEHWCEERRSSYDPLPCLLFSVFGSTSASASNLSSAPQEYTLNEFLTTDFSQRAVKRVCILVTLKMQALPRVMCKSSTLKVFQKSRLTSSLYLGPTQKNFEKYGLVESLN